MCVCVYEQKPILSGMDIQILCGAWSGRVKINFMELYGDKRRDDIEVHLADAKTDRARVIAPSILICCETVYRSEIIK